MVGFFDGLVLGRDFAKWGFVGKDGTMDASQTAQVSTIIDSYDKYYGLMKGTTNRQFTDGLDQFYADYRNRRIEIAHAVWIVLNTISGKSEKEMESIIENFRKYAAQ